MPYTNVQCLVLCRISLIAIKAPIPPPMNERKNSHFSGTRYASTWAEYLSKHMTPNVKKLIIIT